MIEKTCLIIGYGPGVGHGTAMAFGKAGYKLGLICRTPEKVNFALRDLAQSGVLFEVTTGDAGNAKSLRDAIELFVRRRDVDVLHYNVVAPTYAKPTELMPEQLAHDLHADVVGALISVQAVLPSMQANRQGCILFTGGGWAHYPSDRAASPSMGKAALRSLAFTLGQELAQTPIRVGILSIMGQVEEGSAFDPLKIGEAFLEMRTRDDSKHETEWMFTG